MGGKDKGTTENTESTNLSRMSQLQNDKNRRRP
jgi:hypothetical protein